MILFGEIMNKDMLVTIGLLIGTLGIIISVASSFNVRDAVSNALLFRILYLILYV